jgi:hypothetical protein
MDSVQLGIWLYRFHITMILITMIFGIYYPLPVLMFLVPIFLYHFIFQSCPLTRFERSLHKKDITVLDPILEILGRPINKVNRQQVQTSLSFIFLLYLLRASFMRFV